MRSRLHSPCYYGIMKSLWYNLQKKKTKFNATCSIRNSLYSTFFYRDEHTREVNMMYIRNKLLWEFCMKNNIQLKIANSIIDQNHPIKI